MPRRLSYQFSRPANTTTYAANDLVANATSLEQVDAMYWPTSCVTGQGTISRVRVYKSSTTDVNAIFRLHIYEAEPTPSNGDNGAYAIATARYHIGSVECDMSGDAHAGTVGLSKAFSIQGGITFDIAGGATNPQRKLWGLLEAMSDYAPASEEVFIVELETMN